MTDDEELEMLHRAYRDLNDDYKSAKKWLFLLIEQMGGSVKLSAIDFAKIKDEDQLIKYESGRDAYITLKSVRTDQ